MLCQYCGCDLEPDLISREEKAAFSKDNPEGIIVETDLFVKTGVCENCGSYTREESMVSDDLDLLELLDYDRQTEYIEGTRGIRRSVL